jgi:CheY-like chemotaxis protein
MEIKCEECHALIQIPDERVPQNSTFRLNCPRCKRKILANTKTPKSLDECRTNIGLDPSPSAVTHPTNEEAGDSLRDAMDYLSAGQTAALLCMNRTESRGDVKAMLEGLGYVVDIPAATDHALQRLRFNQYQVILLDDDFDGKSPNPLTGYLASLNMNLRREMFVILIGQRFKTADRLQAFVESVNLILNYDDLPQLVTFLSRGLRDHERFYKVFTECLIEAGKKI